jgi:hypothetical protein
VDALRLAGRAVLGRLRGGRLRGRRHGFIAEVGCGQAWFLRAAGELFRRHPVRDVRLSDASRNTFPGGPARRVRIPDVLVRADAVHDCDDGSVLRAPLFSGLRAFGTGVVRYYATAAARWADLSWACVEYGLLAGRPGVALAPLRP